MAAAGGSRVAECPGGLIPPTTQIASLLFEWTSKDFPSWHNKSPPREVEIASKKKIKPPVEPPTRTDTSSP